ncbi:MAG TPA: hypothetical protein VI588_00395 [Candidatus Gracilibacteria bacterium]|nr:hypothetical protein [Candidatus Gracilibacteria bacterium]
MKKKSALLTSLLSLFLLAAALPLAVSAQPGAAPPTGVVDAVFNSLTINNGTSDTLTVATDGSVSSTSSTCDNPWTAPIETNSACNVRVNDPHGLYSITNNLGAALFGRSNSFLGVYGYADNGIGVAGQSPTGFGLLGLSSSNYGIYGASNTGTAVYGVSSSGAGLYGASNSNTAVYGDSAAGLGVYGEGVIGGAFSNPSGSSVWLGTSGPAVLAFGDIYSTNTITAATSIGKVYHLTYNFPAAEITAATPASDGDILHRYSTNDTMWVFPTPTCSGTDSALSIGGTGYWQASGSLNNVKVFKTDLGAQKGNIFVSDPDQSISWWSARVKCFDPTGTKSDQTITATRWST